MVGQFGTLGRWSVWGSMWYMWYMSMWYQAGPGGCQGVGVRKNVRARVFLLALLARG